MAKNSAIILGVVVVVAIAAVAAYCIIDNGEDKAKAPTMGIGDSMTFLVFGTYKNSQDLVDGTLTLKLIDESDTQYKFETETAIYIIDSTGKQTPLYVGKDTKWEDKDSGEDYVDNGKLTVSTFWGKKTLQYAKSADGNTHVLSDGDIVYAMESKYDDSTLYYELTDCSMIKEKKVSRECHDVSIAMNLSIEYQGTKIVGNYTYSANNMKTEIFTKTHADITIYRENDPSYKFTSSSTTWTGPFDDESKMIKVGTERISTAWGDRDTDIYMQSESGSTMSTYAYKEIPVRMVMEEDGLKMTFNATTITVDGKSMTLDEVVALL